MAVLKQMENISNTDKISVETVKAKLAELDQQDHLSYLLKCILLPIAAVIILATLSIVILKYKNVQRGNPSQIKEVTKQPPQSHSQSCSAKNTKNQKENVV